MRISDWSSDVCSSDLQPAEPRILDERGARYHGAGLPGQGQGGPAQDRERTAWIFDFAVLHDRKDGARHEGAALGGDGQSAYDRRQSGHLERAADLSVRLGIFRHVPEADRLRHGDGRAGEGSLMSVYVVGSAAAERKSVV